MDQQQKQKRIQNNQKLKGVTWKESGIPTLTQLAQTSNKKNTESKDYPDDFILDFDNVPVKENGHRLECSCKQCLPKPKTGEAKVLSSVKAEEGIKPLNRREF